jgi:ATP-dependent protease ClpP protease subunit
MTNDNISHILIYSGAINLTQTTSLRNQLAFLNQPQNITTRVLIVLNSYGGNSFEARSLYGLIRSLSFPIEIHAVGHIESAAIPLFLAAEHRTANPDVRFFFHPWTWSTEQHPGHTADGLDQLSMRLADDVSWAKKVFASRTKLTLADIENLRLFEKARIETANFALEHGFIHEVLERKLPASIMTWNITS